MNLSLNNLEIDEIEAFADYTISNINYAPALNYYMTVSGWPREIDNFMYSVPKSILAILPFKIISHEDMDH